MGWVPQQFAAPGCHHFRQTRSRLLRLMLEVNCLSNCPMDHRHYRHHCSWKARRVRIHCHSRGCRPALRVVPPEELRVAPPEERRVVLPVEPRAALPEELRVALPEEQRVVPPEEQRAALPEELQEEPRVELPGVLQADSPESLHPVLAECRLLAIPAVPRPGAGEWQSSYHRRGRALQQRM
jgi:hypothetical protein